MARVLALASDPFLELRGNYERSFDLKGKLQGTGWNVANEFAGKLEKFKKSHTNVLVVISSSISGTMLASLPM